MRLSIVPVTLVLWLAIACGGKTTVPPTAPAPIPSNTATSSPTLTRVTLLPQFVPGFVGDEQQFRAFAVFSDATQRDVTADTTFESSDNSIAEISPAGLLRAVQPGSAEIRGTFQQAQGKFMMPVRYRLGTAPGEIYGRIREAGSDPPYLAGEVEIVGGPYNGRVQRSLFDGGFLFTAVSGAGFDLIARSTGYQPARYRVTEVPAAPVIELQPDPSLVSEVLDASVCPQQPASRSFTTSKGGIFRITGTRLGYYEGGPGVQVLLPNGTPAVPSNADDRVYDFPAGSRLELRISLTFECTTFHVNYLRPRL